MALDAQDGLQTIADKIDNPDEYERQAAINALVALDAKDQAQHIADKINDPVESVRQAAINALAALDAKDQAQRIADKIDDPYRSVRLAAFNALAALDAKDQAQRIADKINDPDEWVRQAAINALAALDAKDQAQRIADKIDDDYGFVSQAAINALFTMDANTPPIVLEILNRSLQVDWERRPEMRVLAFMFSGDNQESIALIHWSGSVPGNVKRQRLNSLRGNTGDVMATLNNLKEGWQVVAKMNDAPNLRSELSVNIAQLIDSACTRSKTLGNSPNIRESGAQSWLSRAIQQGESGLQFVRNITAGSCWDQQSHNALQEWEERLRASGQIHSANTIEKHINAIDRLTTTGWGLSIWAGHAVFWVGLIAIYNRSWAQPVRAFVFWNKWPRRIIGFGYVGLLLVYVPFLRRILFKPFKPSLLADANLDDFVEAHYFSDATVRDQDGVAQPLVKAIPAIKGQILLEGSSGTGKSMYLRYLAKKSDRVTAYLHAAACKSSVEDAILKKLPGLPVDNDFLKQLISAGAVDTIIDGLNEVSAETRARIGDFAQQHFEGNIIMAAQPMEWARPAMAAFHVLQPLGRDQIETYLLGRKVELAIDAKVTGDAFERTARKFLAQSFNAIDAANEDRQLQASLSNPMELSLIAQIICQGKEPDLMAIQEQAYDLMAEDYVATNNGNPFPRLAFAEHCFALRLLDSTAPSSEDWPNEIAALARHRLLLHRVGGNIQGDYVFRHDKIMEFFILPAFLGDQREKRWQEHLDDPRFRGVFLLLAQRLPLEQATILRDQLVEKAADTGDHILSDEIVKLLRDRSKSAEQTQ